MKVQRPLFGALLIGALVASSLVGTAGASPAAAPRSASAGDERAGGAEPAGGQQLAARSDAGINPWLSNPAASAEVDWSYWRAWARAEAEQWAASHPVHRKLEEAEVVQELEAPDQVGANDSPQLAQDIDLSGEGTAAVRISGELAAGPSVTATREGPTGQAGPTEGAEVVVPGTLGQDADNYTISLGAGDVLTLAGSGAARLLQIHAPNGTLVMDSIFNSSSIFPASSPLLRSGNVTAEHVAETTGTYRITVDGNVGAYELEALVFRPGLEGRTGEQTVFLDFDGATLNTAIFGGSGTRTLSPLSSFLSRWGISADDEDELIDAVSAAVEADLALSSVNPGLAVTVTTSKDDPDTFGQTDVSRVIVGGTIAQSGIDTVGIAESIDPGNFESEETALVMLDVLSEPGGRSRPASLNTYMTSRTDRVAFVGEALGTVIAHEIGHYLGNWHTHNRNTTANVMDQGGANNAQFYGVGSDGVGGTADDRQVRFGNDRFASNEGFLGTENTAVRTAWGLAD